MSHLRENKKKDIWWIILVYWLKFLDYESPHLWTQISSSLCHTSIGLKSFIWETLLRIHNIAARAAMINGSTVHL